MNCPVCGARLTRYTYRGTQMHICRKCRGIWFGSGGLREFLVRLLEDRPAIAAPAAAHAEPVTSARPVAEAQKLCPRCRKPMPTFRYAHDSDVILNKCASCQGIWCDALEVDRLASYMRGQAERASQAQDQAQMRGRWEIVAAAQHLSARDVLTILVFRRFFLLPLGDENPRRITPWVVIAIIMANVAVFCWEMSHLDQWQALFNTYGLRPSAILSGRGLGALISSMFMHSGLMHLVGNMFFLWIFGDNVEEAFGHWRFLGFYLLAGVCGGMAHILTHVHSALPAVGASGAVAGVMGAYLALYPEARIRTVVLWRIYDISAGIYLAAWVGLQLLWGGIDVMLGSGSHVAWFDHIGGFACGVAVGLAYRRSRGRSRVRA